MGKPAKGFNAYHCNQGGDLTVRPPAREDTVLAKQKGLSGQQLKTGFEPNGKVCTKPTKSYD
jgi:hypothetical protein